MYNSREAIEGVRRPFPIDRSVTCFTSHVTNHLREAFDPI